MLLTLSNFTWEQVKWKQTLLNIKTGLRVRRNYSCHQHVAPCPKELGMSLTPFSLLIYLKKTVAVSLKIHRDLGRMIKMKKAMGKY